MMCLGSDLNPLKFLCMYLSSSESGWALAVWGDHSSRLSGGKGGGARCTEHHGGDCVKYWCLYGSCVTPARNHVTIICYRPLGRMEQG